MTLQTLIFQPDSVIFLCTVCVTDNNGAKIALTIIISALILLGFANWTWKKYFVNKKKFLSKNNLNNIR